MEDERWKSIELLGELRAGYSCFDEKEEPYYRALSVAITSIRERIYADNEEPAIEDVEAWMPMPKAYKTENKKSCNNCEYYTDAEEIHGVTPCGSCGVDKKNFEQK